MMNITVEHLLAIGVLLLVFLVALFYPFEGNDDDFFNPRPR